ncbi:MAG: Rrf2 family transcriptional regulator [Clostridiales bacterium]|nr:Rrf2 family transcriptional regulator [Clostridiales bacterium]
MKISTRGRYGLRMLIDLSCQQSDTPVTLASIAQRQDVSVSYLERIASDLKRAGYIYSIKGPQGGYHMAKDSKDIVVGDLLRLLEGDVRLTDNHVTHENPLQECIRESVYDVLNEKIEHLVDSITLDTFVNEYKSNI